MHLVNRYVLCTHYVQAWPTLLFWEEMFQMLLRSTLCGVTAHGTAFQDIPSPSKEWGLWSDRSTEAGRIQ